MRKKIAFMFISFVLFSCKKNVDAPDSPQIPIKPSDRTEDQLLKDSIYYYYKLYSLWETSIPSYKVISEFTDSISSMSKVLSVLKSKTPAFTAYSATGGTYDRFSYFTDYNGSSGFSSKLLMDNNDGYGISISFGAITNTEAYPIVSMVEGGSPASEAGIIRSDIILELNGTNMKVEVDCSSGTCKAADSDKYNAIVSSVKSSLTASIMKIKVQRTDNAIKTYDLNYRSYEINPLIADTVFNFSNMNVGYFAYSSFEEVKDNNANQMKIDALFDKFESNNIKSLIVDLRYNGGGYVDAAVYLADKIINSIGKDKLMLKFKVNQYFENSKTQSSSTFKDVYFKKNNDLNLETVCFIVSENTASAAEMVINVLKPYMNIKIVSEGTTTYGKPVGFFEQKIMNRIGLWVTSFALLNANLQADYWVGITGDKQNVTDYIFTNFAEKDEKMIAEAIKFTGAIESSGLKSSRMVLKSSTNKYKMMDVTAVVQKGALKRN